VVSEGVDGGVRTIPVTKWGTGGFELGDWGGVM
jgi:hypothetical protein